jgi:tyrosyl-tRNA synthetase
VMSIPDELMAKYFRLCTALPVDEIDAIECALDGGSQHPNVVKRRLAREIVAEYHNSRAASAAEQAFDRVFKDHQAPQEVAEIPVKLAEDVYLPALLHELGLVDSASDGRRMIDQGGVKIDGESLEPLLYHYARARVDGRIVQVGKRRFARPVAGS